MHRAERVDVLERGQAQTALVFRSWVAEFVRGKTVRDFMQHNGGHEAQNANDDVDDV